MASPIMRDDLNLDLEELRKMVNYKRRSKFRYKWNEMTFTLWVFIRVLHPSFTEVLLKTSVLPDM